ncbi:MAG: DUF3828 domain-containing protein [Thermodesulfobacteriota bacterium]
MRLLLISSLLLMTQSLYACHKGGPDQTVNKFYGVYLKLHSFGIPNEGQQAQYSPYISTELAELLMRADETEQEHEAATKGEEPPLVEGDLFTSLFEGASSYAITSCESNDASAFCVVEFKYLNPGDKSDVKWKDKVYLVKGNRGWAVDDIEYLGDWQFMHKGRLKDLLKEVIEEGNSNSN